MALAELGVNPPRPRARLERRVSVVIVAQLAVAAAFVALSHRTGHLVGSSLPIAALAAAFAVTGWFEMSLELKRHRFTFTLAEAVLVVGLFVVGPLGLGVAAAIGEAIDMVLQRHAPLKVAFNVTNRLSAATVAAVAFAALGRTNSHDSAAWGLALLCALCFSFLDVVSTATVLSIVEEARFHDVFVRSVPAGVLATLAAAPFGLIAINLATRGPLTPLLLVPLAVAVALNSRYAVAQRDEHLRFERLYESLSRTAGLVALDQALGSLASEARSLGTGTVALCCAMTNDEQWVGTRADDAGCSAAPIAAIAAAVALADRAPGTELAVADAPELLAIGADATHAVVVSATHENARRVVLVIVRDGNTNPTAKSRVETIETFAYQAALVVSNALLHEERALALARQIDLNRQKSDFVAAVSHELRTPLGVMLGSVRTLERLDGRMTDVQRQQLFDMTVDQGARLQRLIDKLLLVAAAEHSTVQLEQAEFELDELLASIVSTVSEPIREHVHWSAEPGSVVTDRSTLERIMLNLVENAGKYAPERAIELRAGRNDDVVEFSVVDHGPGIPAADRERVFERFVQLDQSSTRRQGGTGLGLHLCRQLTELVEGNLTLEETPGGGCTFVLRVPARTADVAPAEAPAPTPPQSFSGVRTRPEEFDHRRPEAVR
jgi:K+-sensing histidine kinase KdpD